MAKIKKLVALGCSYTYGHGLPDCWNPQRQTAGTEPSQMSWPNNLARELAIPETVNLSNPGSSTKYALHTLANFSHLDKNCLVTIMYPSHTRSFKIPYNGDHFQGHNPAGTITKTQLYHYWKLYNELDALGTQFLYAEYLKSYVLEKTGRPLLPIIMSYTPDEQNYKTLHPHLQGLPYAKRYFENVINLSVRGDMGIDNWPLAQDKAHPGIQWHTSVAKFVAEVYKKRWM